MFKRKPSSQASRRSSIKTHRSSFTHGSKGSKFRNSYQLLPELPFLPYSVQKIMAFIIKSVKTNMKEYDADLVNELSMKIASDIRTAVKAEGYDRYKYCVFVTIGEKRSHGLYVGMICHWDKNTDNYSYYVDDSPTFFISALCCAFYKE